MFLVLELSPMSQSIVRCVVAQAAVADKTPVFKFQRWRLKGQILPEVLEQYKSVGAELNVLAFCSQFIPMEVIQLPKYESICYHPSILPRGRGASAINWWVDYLLKVLVVTIDAQR